MRKGNNNVIWTESLIIRQAFVAIRQQHSSIFITIIFISIDKLPGCSSNRNLRLVGGREIAASVGAVHDIGYQQDYEHVPTPVR